VLFVVYQDCQIWQKKALIGLLLAPQNLAFGDLLFWLAGDGCLLTDFCPNVVGS